MKKLIALILITALIASMSCFGVFADADGKMISFLPAQYTHSVAQAVEKSEFTEDQIDIENIFIVENTSYINMKKNLDPIMYWVALPISGTSDISYAGFEKDGYVMAFTNFVSLNGMIPPYEAELSRYLSDNGLDEASEVKNMWISERVHVFAFDVICRGEEYIIPYYFTDESSFNKMDDEACVMELGKAYTADEFISLCEKEAELYAAYMAKERENNSKPSTVVDNDGEEDVKKGKAPSEDNKPQKEIYENDESSEQTTSGIKEADDEKIIAESPVDNQNLTVAEKIADLVELGIVEGDPDGNLRLNDYITRAEFCKIACMALNAEPAPASVAPCFSDVDANFWAFGYIETARRYGIVSGYGDDPYFPSFKPHNNITYSESFKMIVEMLGYGIFAQDLGGFPDGYKTVALQDLELFKASVSDYSAHITRGELFEILYNALDVPVVEVYDRANREYAIMNGVYDDTPLKTLRTLMEEE